MDRNSVRDMLCRLNDVVGVSGFEESVGGALAREMEGCYDELRRDALGNYIFVRRGKRDDFRVMVAAHMDEIGLMISDIDDDGYVYFVPVGFYDPRVLVNQVIDIQTAGGSVLGVTGSGTPPHEMKGTDPAAPRIGEIRLDVGARSRSEAAALGVAPGDTAVISGGGRMLGKRTFSGRAVDNRAGCAAMAAAMQKLRGTEIEPTVFACATVQEEIGIKGARVAANAIHPHAALSLDVCFGAADTRVTASHARVYLGGGPAVQAYDWSPGSLLGNIVPRRMRDQLIETARRRRIPHQLEITLNCGTDAAEIALSGTGVLTGGIGIPNRYMHSAVGTVDIGDVYYAAVLTAEWIKGLSRQETAR